MTQSQVSQHPDFCPTICKDPSWSETTTKLHYPIDLFSLKLWVVKHYILGHPLLIRFQESRLHAGDHSWRVLDYPLYKAKKKVFLKFLPDNFWIFLLEISGNA